MTPLAFREEYDPEPDDQAYYAFWDAKSEEPLVTDLVSKGSGAFVDYQGLVDVGDGGRHRAAGDVSGGGG